MIYAAGTELALCKYGIEEEEGKEKIVQNQKKKKHGWRRQAGEGKFLACTCGSFVALSLSPSLSLSLVLSPFLSLSLSLSRRISHSLSLSLSLSLANSHTPTLTHTHKCARPVILSHTYSFLPRSSAVQTMTYSVTSISTVLKTPHENGN